MVARVSAAITTNTVTQYVDGQWGNQMCTLQIQVPAGSAQCVNSILSYFAGAVSIMLPTIITP